MRADLAVARSALMAPIFPIGNGSASSVTFFDIRVDDPILSLRGTEDAAPGARLTGTLVLCLSEPLKIQDIHLRFTGESRIGFPNTIGSRGYVKQQSEFHRQAWTFVTPMKGNSETIPAGNHEWSFAATLTGDMPESVEGISDSWIIYRMKATIDRGSLASNIIRRKHIRVIRSFGMDDLELYHAMSMDNIWPEKLNYSISIPTKAVIFGTNINITFNLIPLLKGLRIGNISTELFETTHLTAEYRISCREARRSRVIARDSWELSDDAETVDIEGQDGHSFIRTISVPKKLKDCVQSVEAKGIKVRHRLKFAIQLQNPDGHLSELRATLPIHIFISPSFPVDADNNIVYEALQGVQASDHLVRNTPPLYGEHHLDQLYVDVDPSGYATPANGSGANTPHLLRSQNGSIENLSTMNSTSPNPLSLNSLESRLGNLQSPGSSRWARDRAQISGGFTSASGSYDHTVEQISRRGSEEDDPIPSGAQTPVHIERITVENLCKVPSYGTALKTPVRTPNSSLPDYEYAISRPPPSVPQQQTPSETRVSFFEERARPAPVQQRSW